MSADPISPADHAAPQPDPIAAAQALAERVSVLERENADYKDRLLRALAEMENLRRRSEREMQDARAYAVTKFAGDMIGTADNLRRALESLPKVEGVESEERAALKPLIEGVELTERELLKSLEKHGVKKREPVGEKFDPHKDQAVFEIPDESVVSGTVLQVMQSGFMIGERVLRPSMVGVSRGGPARAQTSPPLQGEAEGGSNETKNVEPKPHVDTKPHTDTKPKFDKRA